MDDKTLELIKMLAIIGLPALLISYVVIRLLVKLIGHRWFRRFLMLLAFVAMVGGGVFSYVLIADPSPISIILPIVLAVAGAGLGGFFATLRGAG